VIRDFNKDIAARLYNLFCQCFCWLSIPPIFRQWLFRNLRSQTQCCGLACVFNCVWRSFHDPAFSLLGSLVVTSGVPTIVNYLLRRKNHSVSLILRLAIVPVWIKGSEDSLSKTQWQI